MGLVHHAGSLNLVTNLSSSHSFTFSLTMFSSLSADLLFFSLYLGGWAENCSLYPSLSTFICQVPAFSTCSVNLTLSAEWMLSFPLGILNPSVYQSASIFFLCSPPPPNHIHYIILNYPCLFCTCPMFLFLYSALFLVISPLLLFFILVILVFLVPVFP